MKLFVFDVCFFEISKTSTSPMDMKSPVYLLKYVCTVNEASNHHNTRLKTLLPPMLMVGLTLILGKEAHGIKFSSCPHLGI